MAQSSLLQGTLDLLILRTLAAGPLHGVGIADRIKQVTFGAFDVKAGSLFPAQILWVLLACLISKGYRCALLYSH